MPYDAEAEKLIEKQRQLERQNSSLKSNLESLYSVVSGCLLTLDWAIKLGVVLAVWFWPVAQDHKQQAVGLLIYAVLLTLISVGLNKMKEIKGKLSAGSIY